jgi:hypothetical protein
MPWQRLLIGCLYHTCVYHICVYHIRRFVLLDIFASVDRVGFKRIKVTWRLTELTGDTKWN